MPVTVLARLLLSLALHRFPRLGFVGVLAAGLLVGEVAAAPSPAPRRGVLDFNAYYDTRSSTVFTLNTWAQLPLHLEYFSLANVNNSPSAARLEDVDTYLTEQNLRFAPLDSLPSDLSLQWLHRSGPRNDALRTGVRFRFMDAWALGEWLRVNGVTYFVTLFPLQLDFGGPGYRAQVEQFYRIQVLDDALDHRVYLSGFADHNLAFSGGPLTHTLLTEHQLGLRLLGTIYAVIEWRLNQFMATRQSGIGLGLEYVVPLTLEAG